MSLTLCGLQVVVDDEAMSETVWEFPKDRFIEWEQKDESFCRSLGIGREIRRPKDHVYTVGDKMICHSTTLKQIQEQIKQTRERGIFDLLNTDSFYLPPLEPVLFDFPKPKPSFEPPLFPRPFLMSPIY